MTESVELRPNLADLSNDEFFVRGAVVRSVIVPRAFREDLETPSCGQRHGVVQYVSQLKHFSGSYQLRRAQHRLATHVVSRTSLIACALFRSITLAVGRPIH